MLRRLVVLAVLALLGLVPASAGAPPPVAATAYIVIDPATGETLAQRAPDRKLPMASTTKIMTALVVLERADLDDRYTVPPEAVAIGGSSGRLVAGESLAVRDLVTALLVASGNDAAITLAIGLAGSERAFVALMNQRARELGLSATRFANSHGLDAPGHHASVRDLVHLSRVAMRDPFFRHAVALRRATIPGPGGEGTRELESRNDLLDLDAEADGVKTGMTDAAGYALVGHARRSGVQRDLYVALIGAPSEEARARGGARLLDWGFSRYARATLLPAGEVLGEAPVAGRPGTAVPYRAASGLAATIRVGEPISETLVAPPRVTAPIEAGDVLGTVTLRQGGRLLGRRELVAVEPAGEPSVWDRLRSGIEALIP